MNPKFNALNGGNITQLLKERQAYIPLHFHSWTNYKTVQEFVWCLKCITQCYQLSWHPFGQNQMNYLNIDLTRICSSFDNRTPTPNFWHWTNRHWTLFDPSVGNTELKVASLRRCQGQITIAAFNCLLHANISPRRNEREEFWLRKTSISIGSVTF